LQDTPIERLLPVPRARLKSGTTLRELVSAGALANVRTFGGEIRRFHTMMRWFHPTIWPPSFPASTGAAGAQSALSKRKSHLRAWRTQVEVLHTLAAEAARSTPLRRRAPRGHSPRRHAAAERILALPARNRPKMPFNQVVTAIEDGYEVHRVVMRTRLSNCWPGGKETCADESPAVGPLLRDLEKTKFVTTFARRAICWQSCSTSTSLLWKRAGIARPTMPPSKRSARRFSNRPRPSPRSGRHRAGGGLFCGDGRKEAIAVAGKTSSVLRDSGRRANQTSKGKPVGSVTGIRSAFTPGFESSAWRTCLVSNQRNSRRACIMAAYQCERPARRVARILRTGSRTPWPEHFEKLKGDFAEALCRRRTARSARTTRRGLCGRRPVCRARPAARPLFDLMLQYAISEDGSLHAEKFYRTGERRIRGDASGLPLATALALARVTASEFGQPCPGYAEAKGCWGCSAPAS